MVVENFPFNHLISQVGETEIPNAEAQDNGKGREIRGFLGRPLIHWGPSIEMTSKFPSAMPSGALVLKSLSRVTRLFICRAEA